MKLIEGYEYVNCDLCGIDDTEQVLIGKDLLNNLPGEFNVVRCKNCGFVFTNPRPFGEELAKFYPDDASYYTPPVALPPVTTKENRNSVSSNHLTNPIKKLKLYKLIRFFYRNGRRLVILPRNIIQMRQRFIGGIPQFRNNGKLLDVGCSYGNYLVDMRNRGWDVTGIELNKQAAEMGTNRYGLKIINDIFENVNFTEKYDVITMRMVLEHFPRPSTVLGKAYEILKDDGQLIIIVPDFSGIEFRLFREYCYALQVPTHMNHFTPKTLGMFLKKYGFKIDKIVHHSFDRDFAASAKYMCDAKVNTWLAPLISNKVFRKTLLKWVVNLLSYFGQTSRMSVWASKC